ncbi:L-threonine 3-dehydrogenase [bacterium]|mgnify:FL=1|jgi:threonine 3-dehydrogenase|nr:L-threonine 3-dehydrogenase [Mariniblastus sp.]MDB2318158.1 L-threonine 3-dehydrogenase [bacterium]MDB4370894.1 L-threonine 3-dehydrogenase [Mariniblastus sp.]MDB4652539.1 L-threonine 3-dehydrogenase [bacterium]MDC0311396.1 L-threonine 3-dehydrogenase [bacterium]
MTTKLPPTMPAIRKLQDAPGLDWCDAVEVPKIGPREVLIKVTHAGICGTDRHIYEWDTWSQERVKVGITTGHEFVGKVIQVGDAVDRVEIGQRVSGEGHIGCGKCEMCRTGNGHICESVVILGIDCDGCFAPYVAVPEENCWPVSEGISDEIAAVFDPLGNAVHTVMSAGVSGKSVLITGVGIIGLMAVTVAKAAGAGKIFVTDMDERRLKLAEQLGADRAFKATDDWTTEILKLTRGHGPHVMLEMSGNPDAIRDGFSVLRSGGTAAMLGIPSNEITLDLAKLIIFKGTTILGINGRRMFETWYQMENLLLSERLELEPIITHVLEMNEFEKGLKMMQTGEAIKVVIKMPD